jgi:Uma2 family endonuclease
LGRLWDKIQLSVKGEAMPATLVRENYQTTSGNGLRRTVDEWDLLPDDGNRYEIIEGSVYMASHPNITHQIVVGKALARLANYLDENPIGLAVTTPGVIFDRHNGVIPDVVYLSNEKCQTLIYGGKIHGPPDLIIEILSPGKANTERDRVTKLRLYERFGVPAYWIIDARRRSVEIYRRQADALVRVRICQGDEELTTPLLPGFSCAVARLF